MTPVEFLGRLAILVSPPYFPLVRYHGVFGARSKWRALVTLKPPGGVAPRKKKACPEGAEAPIAKAPLPREPAVPASTTATPPVTANGTAGAATSAPNVPPTALAATAVPGAAATVVAPVPAPSAAAAVAVVFGGTTAMTVQHCNRILDGALYAAASRVEWAVLLQRTHGVDAMRCPRCAGKMRVMATIIEHAVVKKSLSHRGVRTEPLPRGRARDPTGQESFDEGAA